MKHKTRKGCKSTRKRKGMKTRRVRVQHGGVKKINHHTTGEYVGEYEGDLDKHGQPQGHGKMTYADGNVYEGNFKDGLANGLGKCEYADGAVYEGKFKNGQRHGRGKMTYADGDVYEGEFENDERHGRGKMTANGDVYIGPWNHNDRHGRGIMRYANGNAYAGNWLNNAMHGGGVMMYANGDVYVGPWYYNNRHGADGKMTYANGDVYEGDFENGQRHGRGKMTYVNGYVCTGDWTDDEINRGIAGRTRGSGEPSAPYLIGEPRVRTDVFSMRTSRQPEATITLSDGIEYNNHQANGLLQLIKTSGQLRNLVRTQLTAHDIEMLKLFVRFFTGGKKKNGHKRLRRSVGNPQ